MTLKSKMVTTQSRACAQFSELALRVTFLLSKKWHHCHRGGTRERQCASHKKVLVLSNEQNIATGETSQAITPLHFFGYSDFSGFCHLKTYANSITYTIPIIVLITIIVIIVINVINVIIGIIVIIVIVFMVVTFGIVVIVVIVVNIVIMFIVVTSVKSLSAE